MTNAHRPTWHNAVGGDGQGGNVMINPTRAYSSRDMPSHTKLKERLPGQGAREDLMSMDFKQDLFNRESEIMQMSLGKRAAEPLIDDSSVKRLKTDTLQ
jgi:protein CWC15